MNKKKILIIVLGVLLGLSIAVSIWYFVIREKSILVSNQVSYYNCEIETINFNNDIIYKNYVGELVNIKENKVIGIKSINRYVYKTKEAYENTKLWNKQEKFDYEYNDSELTVEIIEKEAKKIVDEENKEIITTDEEYLNSLKEIGYTCNKVE